MKDILVEFHDYGAIIYKDPATIEIKKDLPNCFVNPDLSKVYGVSPSYWTLNEYNKIIKCSEEEMQRRNTYHTTLVVSSNNTQKAVEKVHIEDLREEFKEKFDHKEELLRQEINRLKQEIAQSQNLTNEQISDLVSSLNKNREMLALTNIEMVAIQQKNEKTHKKLAAAIILAIGLGAAVKLLLF
jgi:hypothetical protein